MKVENNVKTSWNYNLVPSHPPKIKNENYKDSGQERGSTNTENKNKIHLY